MKEALILEQAPTISVIIPTHNRRASLLRTLDSLCHQTYSMDRVTVIIVDDSSTDDTQTIADQQFPFHLCYLHQKQQGATVARNNGAKISQAEILVFIDDDVTISSQALEALVEICCQWSKVIVVGTIHRRSSEIASVYTRVFLTYAGNSQTAEGDVELLFIDCNTELLACRRSDFFVLGMLQDPTGGYGWPNWDDVEFGYRAYLNGYRLLQSGRAIGEHWDHSISDRTKACQRWYRASKSAVWLFNRHQELHSLIPMLSDKIPLAWGQDTPSLIARKLARNLLSTRPFFWTTEKLINFLEQHYPSPVVLHRLYGFLNGACMSQGYREGLRDFVLEGGQE